MQQFIYYYKQLYMFRASICPSSGVLGPEDGHIDARNM